MDTIISDLLKKAVSAHKSSDLSEAKRLYLKILEKQPQNPDANHNLGIISVQTERSTEALTYFENALRSNQYVPQFWISYIKQLLQLNLIDSAMENFEKAKIIGATGPTFDKLKKEIEDKITTETPVNKKLDSFYLRSTPKPDRISDHSIFSNELTLHDLARTYRDTQIKTSTVNTASQNSLKVSSQSENEVFASEPEPQKLEAILQLRNSNKLEEAMSGISQILTEFPRSFLTYGMLGVVKLTKGHQNHAMQALLKAVELQPNFAEAHNNIGVILAENDLMDEAIEAYKKSILIMPNFTDALNNLGNAFISKGDIDRAIEAYTKALDLNADFADCIENLFDLLIQLQPSNYTKLKNARQLINKTSAEIKGRPRYVIQKSIFSYILGDREQAKNHILELQQVSEQSIQNLTPQNRIFFSAYKKFLSQLLNYTTNSDTLLLEGNEIYHMGESHCLSYAHQYMSVMGKKNKIIPKMVFGAKAFHFNKENVNRFTQVAKIHLASIPRNSTVFLSFGEIDCRVSEGFLTAAKKYSRPIEDIVKTTVASYIEWFANENSEHQHNLHFFNIPAPIIDTAYNMDTNKEVVYAIKLFNAILKEQVNKYRFKLLDVYQFTSLDNGFSNERYHIDGRHLGPAAISEIEKQFDE